MTASVQAFRALHQRTQVLVLPNAWDAASAAIARAIGAEAIATTSAGVAWACGYPDGDVLPHDERLFAIRAVVRVAADLPVSVDFESGYSNDPQAVAALVCKLRSLGVAGINLEDGDGSAELLERKISAIKRELQSSGDDIFINARTDVYLREIATGAAALREAAERARRYEAAGADGIFVPMVSEARDIAEVAAATALPLNVLPVPGLPPAGELYALGVRRLSAGGRLAECAYGAARDAARAFLQTGNSATLYAQKSTTYAEMNELFTSTS